MRLVTCHPYGFDITKDELDLTKSSNLNHDFDFNSMFKNAYEWLFKKIGNDRLIWCYKVNDTPYNTVKGNGNNLNHGEEKVIWTLEVPDSECIIINAHSWNCVINKWPYYKEELIKDISDEDYDKLMESLKGTEEKSWHDSIFNIENENIEVLIKSPVSKEYVINTEWICDYDLERFNEDDGIVRSLYYDEEKMNRDKLIYESALKGRNIKYSLKVDKTKNNAPIGGNICFVLHIDWVKSS